MTKNLDKEGLRSIAHKYELFYVDIWGVVHNGIKIYENAIIALKEMLKFTYNWYSEIGSKNYY